MKVLSSFKLPSNITYYKMRAPAHIYVTGTTHKAKGQRIEKDDENCCESKKKKKILYQKKERKRFNYE